MLRSVNNCVAFLSDEELGARMSAEGTILIACVTTDNTRTLQAKWNLVTQRGDSKVQAESHPIEVWTGDAITLKGDAPWAAGA
jgi:hypothetical protein